MGYHCITCLGSRHDVHRAPLLHDRRTCIDNEIPSRMWSLAAQLSFQERSFPFEHPTINICLMISHEYAWICMNDHECLKCQDCQGTDLSDCSAMASAFLLPWSWDASCASCANGALSQATLQQARPEWTKRQRIPKCRQASWNTLEYPGMISIKGDDAKCCSVTWLCSGDQQSTS